MERDNFRALFAEIPEVVCILAGKDHRFEFVNDAHRKLLGFNATGKTVREAQPESVEAHAILDDVFQSGKVAKLSEIPITVGDRVRYFNLTYSPRRAATGEVDGIMVLGIEVTEHVLRTIGFRLQSDALESALNGSPLSHVLELLVRMVECQVGGRLIGSILLASADEKTLLHGAAVGLPKEYNDAIHGIEIGDNVGSCGTAAFLRVPVAVEDIAKDPRWEKYREFGLKFGLRACWSNPIISSQGRLLGTFALYSRRAQAPSQNELQIVDVAARTTALIIERQMEFTERLVEARAREESQSRLTLALHSGEIGLWDWNAKTGYVYLSDTLLNDWQIDARTFGHTLPECMERIHPEDRDRVWAEIKLSTFEERPYDTDYRVQRPDGSTIWVNAKGRYFVDPSGEPERLTGITLNITQRRKIAQELELAKEEAERANHLKSAFLANMSHEIRTPLGAMMGFAELLGEPGSSVADRKNYIDILRRNGEQLGHVINDILDLSKVETGHINFEYLKVSPASIAHEVVSLMSVLANEKGLALSFDDDGTTPEEIITDPTRMRQVLINLVSNSLKFTKVGWVRISLSGYRGKRDEKCCAFEVSDTGIGIPPAAEERLFKMFSQADNSMTRNFGGTGLGLALSRSLARAMGGNVRLVRSQVDVGSTFHFSVESREDLLSEVNQNAKGADREVLEELPLDALSGIRVLLVEDSADNQELIWRYLSKYGARVEIADNGLEGIRKALESDHDVVLCDLQMPVMDGYTAVGKLRARGYQTPIVALTAHAMADVRKKCQDIGCNDHLPKPINSRDLVDTVRRFAHSKAHRRSGQI